MNALAIATRAAVLAMMTAAASPAGAQPQPQLQFSLTLYDQLDYRGGSVTFYGDNANIGSTGFAEKARSAQVRGVWRLCEGGGFRNRCEVLNANVRDLDAYGLAGRVGSAQRLSGAPRALPPAPAPPPYVAQPYVPQPYVPQPYAPQAYAPPPYAPPPYVPPEPAPRPAPPAAEPTYVAPYTATPPYGPGAYDPDAYAPPAVDAPLPAPGRLSRGLPAPAPAQPAPVAAAPPPYVSGTFAEDPAQGASTVFFPRPLIRGADVSAAAPRAADGFCRYQGLGAAMHFDQSQTALYAVDTDGRAVAGGPVLRDVLCRRS